MGRQTNSYCQPRAAPRITAVYAAVIITIFVGQQYPAIVAKLGPEGRVYGEAPTIEKITMVVELFIKPIDAKGCRFADAQIQVAAEIISTKAVNAGGSFAKLTIGNRRFGHTVNDAAATAATKDHRIGALMDLDPLDIIKRPEILNVITYAVDEEIGGGILAPDGDLVAISFTLANRCTRRVAKNIANILKRLIVKLLSGYNRDTLRCINQRCVGFQARAADRNIAFFFTGYDNLLIICEAFFQRLCGSDMDWTRCNRGEADRNKEAQRAARNNIHKQSS